MPDAEGGNNNYTALFTQDYSIKCELLGLKNDREQTSPDINTSSDGPLLIIKVYECGLQCTHIHTANNGL